MRDIIPYVNLTLLTILAGLAIGVAVWVTVTKLERAAQQALMVFLAADFTYVVVFIYFTVVNPLPEPPAWLQRPYGQVAYWPIYVSLIVAYLGYIKSKFEERTSERKLREIIEGLENE